MLSGGKHVTDASGRKHVSRGKDREYTSGDIKRKVTSVILFFISLGSKETAFLDYIVFSALLVHLVYHRYTNAIFVVDS